VLGPAGRTVGAWWSTGRCSTAPRRSGPAASGRLRALLDGRRQPRDSAFVRPTTPLSRTPAGADARWIGGACTRAGQAGEASSLLCRNSRMPAVARSLAGLHAMPRVATGPFEGPAGRREQRSSVAVSAVHARRDRVAEGGGLDGLRASLVAWRRTVAGGEAAIRTEAAGPDIAGAQRQPPRFCFGGVLVGRGCRWWPARGAPTPRKTWCVGSQQWLAAGFRPRLGVGVPGRGRVVGWCGCGRRGR
jgi:hypothetical protein